MSPLGHTIIDVIFLLNGVYDLACAVSILSGVGFLSSLHPAMFTNSPDPIVRRLLAYWLFTYGTARTAAGLHRDLGLDLVGSLTYFIEALCFEYECRYGGTMVASKVTFVSIFSFVLGILVNFIFASSCN